MNKPGILGLNLLIGAVLWNGCAQLNEMGSKGGERPATREELKRSSKAADDEVRDDATKRSVGSATAEPIARPRTLAEARRQRAMLTDEKMKQDGSVQQRGKISLDATPTAFGSYDAALVATVQQRWYDLVDNSQFSQRSGKVVLKFRLHYDGRITDLKMAGNEVGEMLGLLCQRAVLDPNPYAPWPSDMRRESAPKNYRDLVLTFYYEGPPASPSAAYTPPPEVKKDPGPEPKDYEYLVEKWLRANLRDPSSVTDLSIHPPFGTDDTTGQWKLLVYFNSKNAFGGYTGIQMYLFGIRDREVTLLRGP